MINFKNKNNLKKQKGVTLIEVLAVVIIGVLIIVGAFTLYGNAQDKQNENATMTGIMSIQANVRDLFYGQGYEEVDVATMESAGGVPSSFPRTGSTGLSHPLGGEVDIVPVDGGSNFAISVTGLSQTACTTMSTRANGFIEIRGAVDGTALDSVDTRTTHCNGGDASLFFISR